MENLVFSNNEIAIRNCVPQGEECEFCPAGWYQKGVGSHACLQIPDGMAATDIAMLFI